MEISGSAFVMAKSGSGIGQAMLADPLIWSCQGHFGLLGLVIGAGAVAELHFPGDLLLTNPVYLWIKWRMSDCCLGCVCGAEEPK